MLDYSFRSYPHYFAHWYAKEHFLLSPLVSWITAINHSHGMASAKRGHYTQRSDGINFFILGFELCCKHFRTMAFFIRRFFWVSVGNNMASTQKGRKLKSNS